MDHLIDTLTLDQERVAAGEARLVTATVTSANDDVAMLTFTRDGATVTGQMPVSEFQPGRTWQVGQLVLALVCDDTERPLLSTVRPEIVEALLAGVSPEIRTGSVRIMGVARKAGVRTKVAVAATAADVDPVAACVGRQHNRVDYLKASLLGEQVDIIAWHPQPEEFLRNALQPASVTEVAIDATTRTAIATAPTHQMSAAVGGQGLNSALAAQLVGLGSVRIVPEA